MRAGGEGKKSWTPDLTALLQDLKRPLPMLLRLGVFEVSGVSSSANVCVCAHRHNKRFFRGSDWSWSHEPIVL